MAYGAGMAVRIVHGRVSEQARTTAWVSQSKFGVQGKQFFPNRSKPAGPSISAGSLDVCRFSQHIEMRT